MARKRPTDKNDPQGQPAPAASGASPSRGGSGRAARARPGPTGKDPKPGSVTKSVQRGRFSRFLQECVVELKKVTWPTRTQLIQATVVVIVAVAIVAAFLGLADAASEWLVDRVF